MPEGFYCPEGKSGEQKDRIALYAGAWVKYKLNRSQEFVIGGYTAGNPFDALIVGCYDAGNLKYVGTMRAGFVPHMRCAMMPLLQELTTDQCPFADLPEKRRTLRSAEMR
jgi:ATP-dependent DNA ligase